MLYFFLFIIHVITAKDQYLVEQTFDAFSTDPWDEKNDENRKENIKLQTPLKGDYTSFL